MRFADIPFHDDIKQRLRDMVDTDRVPHALLLEGPAGSGKFSLARAFVQYLHCTDRQNGEPCGCCPACLQHQGFNHIDTVYSYPVVKREGSSSAPLSADYAEEFRDFVSESPFMNFELWLEKLNKNNAQPLIYVEEGTELLRRLGFTAHAARFKVVLMWLPERLKEETANKLLKLIEEPADDTRIVMVSNNPSAILPTIYSRLQRITVPRYDDAEVASWLATAKGLSQNDAVSVAALAEGNINRAEGLTGASVRGKSNLENFISLMRLAYQRKIIELRPWANNLAAEGRESVMAFFEYASRMLRENFVYALHVGRLQCLNNEEDAFSRNFSPFVNERNVEDLMKVFDDARIDVAANANAKIVCFDVAIKVILLLKR